ncbi:hypothetical protein GYMLUDRAFT_62328 [Collybiopsis luxurians FD-317 M1]|uniref:ATP-dependent DNA helicase n=1 Tax=Collybiopsis luxurians FD-317 M1 TaxID=944289 RepID=A0A0D0AYW0_9AGAR|nr:hypothetical protein GYMLUDRAFT_62328 [Collybiopsis luxurians FD-317 M1]
MPLEVTNILDATVSSGLYKFNDVDPAIKDQFSAEYSMKEILKEKEFQIFKYLENALQVQDAIKQQCYHHVSTVIPQPFSTNMTFEIEHAKQLFLKFTIALIQKHRLNDYQTVAFLLLAENVGRQIETLLINILSLQMLVTGPGGTGKSQIFEAWSEFHQELGCIHAFCLTAPTGVVASDIGGCTIHAEVALQKIQCELEWHLGPLKTLVVDEIYFMDPKDMSLLSEYCSLVNGITEHPFRKLNFITHGDPSQLPPPGSSPLFDSDLVNCFRSNNLNALNESTQYKVKGIQAWHQVNDVVILTEIMRQKVIIY